MKKRRKPYTIKNREEFVERRRVGGIARWAAMSEAAKRKSILKMNLARLVKMGLLVLLLLGFCQRVEAAVIHDCRMKGISIQAFRISLGISPGYFVRIRYVGLDDGFLKPSLCPDQLPPTVGTTDPNVLFLQRDDLGYAYFAQPDPGLFTVDASTLQGPDARAFYSIRTFRIP